MIELTTTPKESTETREGDGLKFTLEEVPSSSISIKAIGIGGCGGNIVDFMIDSGLGCVDFACVNTDEQALETCRAPFKLRMGQRVTQGYGTGSNPEVGREAALENTEELTELLGDADMVFLALGLGGGTGTGAAPVISSLAKQMGALTIAAAVKPFSFEGKRRTDTAEAGLDTLLEQVDTAIVIPNERLLGQIEAGSGFFDGFRVANQIATQTLEGITDLITKTGIMNSDFADVRSVFQDAGIAVVGSAQCGGRDAAIQAAREAIGSPVMEHEGLTQAGKVLVNITGSGQFGMHDASDALQLIQREIAGEADLTVGVVRDDSLGEEVRVMLIASGLVRETFRIPSKNKQASVGSRYANRESAWESENVADLMGPGDGLPQASADQAPSVAEELPAHAVSQVEPLDSRESSGDPAIEAERVQPPNGSPYEFMPPPNIRADEETKEDPTLAKPSFFRRRSIFG